MRYLFILCAATLVLSACRPGANRTEMTDIEPPIATALAETLVAHGQARVDPYYWLKERENPEVIAYLEQENAYQEALTAHLEDLRQELFEEIKGRIKQDDSSVPYRDRSFFYYTRYEEGKERPIFCRKPESLDAEEEVMLDSNELAEGFEYYRIGNWDVSSGENVLAYAFDTTGRRLHNIRFKDLATGEMLPDAIDDVTGNLAWANDNQTLFYTRQDPTTLRSYQVYRHTLGTDPSEDDLVYQEDDPEFSLYVYKTKSRDYLMLVSGQSLSTEYRFLAADNPNGEFAVLQPREENLEYEADHFGDHFYIRTNLDSKNFRLMRTPVSAAAREHWEEVIAHRDDVLLEGFEIFRNHLVAVERSNGLLKLRVMPWSGSGEHYVDFGEPAYLAYPQNNPSFDTNVVRYFYSSLTTPNSVIDYNMDTREAELLKRDEILDAAFSPDNYVAERLTAPARDGTGVPISLVYRKGLERDGSNPLLLYAYGSYGYSTDARFDAARLSLLDRGFVYAIAHVRGGQELGRAWYEDGKLLKKKNTFTDFIDCGEFLVEEGYTATDRLFANGGSAGGLLMGAVANVAPELFKGIVADVPWVDVVTTMFDDSIPLTTSEYDEWGNPNDREYYDYMLSYSPYDNVEAKDYPNLLVTTSLNDSQVQYFEPAKWVAKLRTTKTGNNLLLLKTNMMAGHGGGSGRYEQYEESAYMYAFLLDLVE